MREKKKKRFKAIAALLLAIAMVVTGLPVSGLQVKSVKANDANPDATKKNKLDEVSINVPIPEAGTLVINPNCIEVLTEGISVDESELSLADFYAQEYDTETTYAVPGETFIIGAYLACDEMFYLSSDAKFILNGKEYPGSWYTITSTGVTFVYRFTMPGTAVKSITLDENSIELKTYETKSLIATLAPEDATLKTVIWESEDPTIASVDENGVVKARKVGTTTITATARGGMNKTATCEVTVKAGDPVTTVSIKGIDAPVAGEKLDQTAESASTGVGTTAPKITWDTTDTEADYGTIYTASVTLEPAAGYSFVDSVQITVNNQEATSSNLNEDGTITVTYKFPATANKTPITAVDITGIEEPVAGELLDTTAECATTGVETNKLDITWNIEGTKAAYEKQYSAKVTLKPAKGYVFSNNLSVTFDGKTVSLLNVYVNDDGTATIYRGFNHTADRTVIEEFYVEINAPVTGQALDQIAECTTTGIDATEAEITWDPEATKAEGGTTYRASVTLKAAEGYKFDLDAWAYVNGADENVWVEDWSYEQLTVVCEFPETEEVVFVDGLTLNKTATTLKAGDEETLQVTVAPEDATNKEEAWSSSNPDVATVSTEGVVTAIAKGTATITATSENGKTANIVITVTDELQDAKDAAKEELDSYKNASDYEEAQQTELAAAISAGKTAIDAATTKDGVADALKNAKSEIDKIKTAAEFATSKDIADNTWDIVSIESTKAVLTKIEGAEYSKDGGVTWQDSNEFTELTAGTEYTFAVRIKAVEDKLAGKAASKTAKTPKVGEIESKAEVESGAPKTEFAQSTEDLAKILLTQADSDKIIAGDDISISIVVKDGSKTITDANKKLIEDGTEGYTAGAFLDITLLKKFASETEATAVHTTTSGIKIVIDVPADLINEDENVVRTYAVARVHEGKLDILGADFNAETKKLTFTSDKFSDYAIIYRDAAKYDDEEEYTDNNVAAPSVNTGDDFNASLWMMLMALSILGMLGSVVYKRRNSDI